MVMSVINFVLSKLAQCTPQHNVRLLSHKISGALVVYFGDTALAKTEFDELGQPLVIEIISTSVFVILFCLVACAVVYSSNIVFTVTLI